MKCLERLVAQHIKACLPASFDPHQFAYRANRSTEDAIAITLHSTLSHLEHPGTYARLLFIDYSSAFNTIIPDILINKLLGLHLPASTCAWIKDFLSNRPQQVRLGPHLSSPLTLSTGSPQGCVLSPLLYTLYTSDCSPSHPSNLIIKFADDTTVVGLISGGDETAYRDEVQQLSAWGSANYLQLNTSKTKVIIIDFRRHSPAHAPLHINGDCVERAPSCKFLGTYISQELSWSINTTAIKKKAQQRLHFLRILRKNHLERKLLVSFYRSTIESVLTYCITAWYAGSSAADRTALQRVIGTAQMITGCPLPSLEELASSRCRNRTSAILKDAAHPAHHLFDLLPSGRRYRSMKSRTTRLTNSFFPWAIRTLNKNNPCAIHRQPHNRSPLPLDIPHLAYLPGPAAI
uniref:Reverse transcriptase domain-containing protein n=1 Tax=Gadus morhua TaxID=8049 RepID=A0A8C5AV64_GADMO